MRNERGSATPLLALLVVMLAGLGFGLGRLGGLVNTRAAAQSAADAAALAGAAAGEGAARELAAANGAEVRRLERDDGEVEVEVRIGRVTAVARAAGAGGVGGGVRAAGLVPELRAALVQAGRLLGAPVPITSGWRSTATQQRLYDARRANPFPVARPGTSMHERGRAVDVPRSFVARLAAVAPAVGLCHPWPETDPVHFELCASP